MEWLEYFDENKCEMSPSLAIMKLYVMRSHYVDRNLEEVADIGNDLLGSSILLSTNAINEIEQMMNVAVYELGVIDRISSKKDNQIILKNRMQFLLILIAITVVGYAIRYYIYSKSNKS